MTVNQIFKKLAAIWVVQSEILHWVRSIVEHLREYNLAVPAAPAPQDPEEDKESDWLDNQRVMRRLRLSESTMYRLRRDKKIAFTEINGRFYYRLSDVEKLFKDKYRKA